MTTSLHISHTVHDFDAWLDTFRSFSDFRTQGGVTGLSVRHGVDRSNLVAVDLDFASVDEARAFLARLESDIWPGSPHFEGTPTAFILEAVGVPA